MAVYLVTSADVGAPSLSGTNGAGCTVFDYILNTVAGLTIAYTGTNKRVYTMPNGDVIRIVHDSAVTGQQYFMLVRAAESASAVDTIVDPYPTTAQVADGACVVRVSSTNDATARAWWAVVDTSATTGCFYFFADYSNGGYVSGTWWAGGTQISCLPSDNYAACMFTRNTTSTSTGGALNSPSYFGGGVGSGTVTHAYLKRSADGTVKSCLSAGAGAGGSTGGDYFGGSGPGGPDAPSPVDGKIRQTHISMCDYYSQTITYGSGAEFMRLYLPRCFQPLHRASGYSGIANGDTWADTSYGASAKFIFMKCGSSVGSAGGLIIQYDGTWTNPNG